MSKTGWGLAALAAYVGTIVGANYAIGHWGWGCDPGPCTVPVGLGLWAPSGVLFVGAALAARDAVQQTLGRRWSVAAIVVGAALSYLVSAPVVALASGAAFLLSELADLAVYTPLRAAGRTPLAVALSGTVGGLVDSAVFLLLAFGSLQFLAGQWLGKTEIALLGALIVALWRVAAKRREVASA